MPDYPWFKHYEPGLPRTLKPYPDCTMLDVVRDGVAERPNHIALIFKGAKMTAAEFDKQSDAFGAALTDLGVQKGERVALLLPNSPQCVIAQYGAWKAGAIVAPLNALYTERELELMLNEIGAETVVVLSRFYHKLKAIQPRTSVKRVIVTNIKDYLPPLLRVLYTLVKEHQEGDRVELQPQDIGWGPLMNKHVGARPSVAVRPTDPAILLFSGGTTGTPKAALGTHHMVYMAARQLHAYAHTILVDWDDTLTLILPTFHIYGNWAMNTSFVAHWPIAIVPNPRDFDDLIDVVEKVKPAVLHGVPTLFNALINHPRVQAGKVNFKSLKICYAGAAPLLLETKKRFEALTGGWLVEAYGMTETMLAAVVCPVHAPYKEGSTGIPLPDVEVRIVDVLTGTKSLTPGEVGEVIIRAPQLMAGYWNRPAESAEMVRDGWMYTGDIGYMDEDGYLFIVDRKKDLIKPAGGFQVWPREVEEVLAQHPAVAEVSVAGTRDPSLGEVVTAFIVLRAGRQLTAEELSAFCREKLAGYKVPKRIEFRDALPKTMVGKVLRRQLVAEDKK